VSNLRVSAVECKGWKQYRQNAGEFQKPRPYGGGARPDVPLPVPMEKVQSQLLKKSQYLFTGGGGLKSGFREVLAVSGNLGRGDAPPTRRVQN